MSFLSEFCEYAKTRTDCPPDFHLHAGMVALSTALGNGAWCEGWSRNVYANLWAVNIAPSGYGKSVSIDLAESLIEQAGLSDRKLPGSFSQEGLIKHLEKSPQGIWFLQEFSSFLAMISRSYNDGSQQWLTEAFDVPSEMPRVLSNERIMLRKPCISILGASSPAWFAAVYQESALRGGFLARFLFCPSSTPGEYVGHPGARDRAHESSLAWHLQKLSRIQGQFDLSEVRSMFREWDENHRTTLRKDCPPEFSGMRSRAGLMVLKAAMLFHVSNDLESLTITKRELANAIHYIETSHAKAEKFLTDQVAGDKKGQDRLRVMDMLQRATGKIEWASALRRVRMDAREFQTAVNTLEAAGQVCVEYEGRRRIIVDPNFVELSKLSVEADPGATKFGEDLTNRINGTHHLEMPQVDELSNHTSTIHFDVRHEPVEPGAGS